MPLDAMQSVAAFSMNKNKIWINLLSGFCFLSSLSDILFLKIPHGSSRLNCARALKNLIRRPHSSEKRGREKRLLPCTCGPFYCANVK